MYATFRNGKWIEYTPRIVDARWLSKQNWDAAAIFATAVTKGFSTNTAHTLAEAIVFKTLYKDIQYNEQLERLLRSFMDHVETA